MNSNAIEELAILIIIASHFIIASQLLQQSKITRFFKARASRTLTLLSSAFILIPITGFLPQVMDINDTFLLWSNRVLAIVCLWLTLSNQAFVITSFLRWCQHDRRDDP